MNILRNPAHPAHPSVYACCSLVVCVSLSSARARSGTSPRAHSTSRPGHTSDGEEKGSCQWNVLWKRPWQFLDGRLLQAACSFGMASMVFAAFARAVVKGSSGSGAHVPQSSFSLKSSSTGSIIGFARTWTLAEPSLPGPGEHVGIDLGKKLQICMYVFAFCGHS